MLFPPLLEFALPIGFSKRRRRWPMGRISGDFAVLKLSKSNRKLILPAIETKSGVSVGGNGDDE